MNVNSAAVQSNHLVRKRQPEAATGDIANTFIVTAEKINQTVRITVADDGQGINSDDIERIWQRGWQVKNAQQGASGLGLTIAQQILQLHQGKIWVESGGDGRGTKFTFSIPLVDISQPAPSQQKHQDG